MELVLLILEAFSVAAVIAIVVAGFWKAPWLILAGLIGMVMVLRRIPIAATSPSDHEGEMPEDDRHQALEISTSPNAIPDQLSYRGRPYERSQNLRPNFKPQEKFQIKYRGNSQKSDNHQGNIPQGEQTGKYRGVSWHRQSDSSDN